MSMTNEELNKALYDKMSAEMDAYRNRLMTRPPEKILENAYEYALKEDILLWLENNDLDDDQARALLNIENPLYKAYDAFENLRTGHMDFIQMSFENVAEEAVRRERERRRELKETPLYLFSGSYARQHGELEQYRASRRANIACRDAIDAAIQEYFQDFYVDAAAVQKVVEDFGYERMFHVLAVTVRQKSGDERFSGENRRWAMTIPVNENPDGDRNSAIVLRSHPVKADAFITTARRGYLMSLDVTLQDGNPVNRQDREAEYEKAEIFGIPALFADERISAADVPEGLYRYDLRGSDNDPGRPVAVENHVKVNHAGTLITARPLDIPANECLPLTEENGLDFQGEACTIQQFRDEQKQERGEVKAKIGDSHETKQGRNTGKSGKKRASRER